MNARTQITMDPEVQRRAHEKAADLGISFAEYIRRLVVSDLGSAEPNVDVSALFDLVDEGPTTDIARDKDRMLDEAVWQAHLLRAARKPRRARARARHS